MYVRISSMALSAAWYLRIHHHHHGVILAAAAPDRIVADNDRGEVFVAYHQVAESRGRHLG